MARNSAGTRPWGLKNYNYWVAFFAYIAYIVRMEGHIALPTQLHRAIKVAAATRGVSMKQFVAEAITQYLRPKRRKPRAALSDQPA